MLPNTAYTSLLKLSHTSCSVAFGSPFGTYIERTTPTPLSMPVLTPTSRSSVR